VTARGISLHIGLNAVDPSHYDGWSGHLSGCEPDAEDMSSLAESRGFAPAILETAAATRRNVLERIRAAAGDLREGDMLLLTYSGHGGQVPDMGRDERDRKDETWCLYDGQLLDDELRLLWSDFTAGVRILVLSDSCHSGTAVRAPLRREASLTSTGTPTGHEKSSVLFRAMPVEVALRTYRRNAAFYDSLRPRCTPPAEKLKTRIRATVRLLSGCQDNQLSIDGTENGLFTGTLLRVWDGGRFAGDYAAFHRAILDLMPPTQSPKHLVIGARHPAYAAQVPFTI
jgi:hypothetical protein